jgi:succinyl-diaminopimelate desuccinylase
MDRWCDAYLADLSELCAIPSLKGPATSQAPYGEATRQALLLFLEQGRRLGFRAVNLDNRAGYVEWGDSGPIVAALCHLDVVPAGVGWTGDPFRAVVRDGRIIARGVIDNKGPAVAVLYAMKTLLDTGYRPCGRIRLIVGLDEENGSSCMAHYVQTAELPAAGFTPDATFPVIFAEKGIVWLELSARGGQPADAPCRLVRAQAGERPNMVPGRCSLTFSDPTGHCDETVVNGEPAHASMPWDGRNAIGLAMTRAAAHLAAAGCAHPFVDFYQAVLGQDWRGQGLGIAGADVSGPLTVNSGLLQLDEQTAHLTLDIRYPVSWSLDRLLAALQTHCDNQPGLTVSLKVLHHGLPLHVPQDAPPVRILTELYEEMTGCDGTPVAIGGGTYARTMPGLLAFGAIFPGETESAHQVGESASIDSLLAGAALYGQALLKLDRLVK